MILYRLAPMIEMFVVYLSIPLSSWFPRDEITLAFSRYGVYLVKSAYMMGKGCNLNDFYQAWVDIWSLDVIHKVRHFMWMMCSLLVRGLLKACHLLDDTPCP